MNGLDLFRNFRRGVARPSEDARRQAAARLASTIEGEHRPRRGVLPLIRRRPRRAAVVFATAIAIAAAALFVESPWKSTGFLDRAQAALTAPDGTVLYFKVVYAGRYGPNCAFTTPAIEYWVDQTPPYTYRALEVTQPNPCKDGNSIEIGGEANSPTTLILRKPNTLATIGRWPLPAEWVAGLRQAIADSAAQYDGRTVLDGRTVERIRYGCSHAQFPPCIPSYAYVDPKDLHPVRVEWGGGRFYQDFLKYKYLPGTPANRALADIRAQHPDAKEQP